MRLVTEEQIQSFMEIEVEHNITSAPIAPGWNIQLVAQ